jgi:hypothetical protein
VTANDTPRGNPNQDTRDGKGRYHRTLNTAERDRQAAELFDQGWTYQAIADELGWDHKSSAIRAVRRAVRDVVQEAGAAVLRTHINRLEYLYNAAVEILEGEHVVVSHGRIVYNDDGQPLQDSGPKLAAIREARASMESFRKLTGMDKPAKVEHSGGVTFEIVGVDPQDLV